jgi:AcrR family transcriptional regulator
MKKTASKRKVLSHVLALDGTKGHLKWKVSELARRVGMTRPLVYYHFGRTKLEILENSLELLADEFYGFSRPFEKAPKLGTKEFEEDFVRAQRFISKFPGLTILYVRCRTGESPLRKKFIEFEKKFQNKLKYQCPGIDQPTAEALHVLLHGIVHAPFSDEQAVRNSLQELRRRYFKV